MQTKLNVEGMSCRHCEMSITKAITAIAGVGHVEADLKNGTVTVTHDESTGAGSIIAEIEKIGFEVRE